MDHGLGLISPILGILEIEVSNILYNPGNIGNLSCSTSSYPGSIGKRIFSILSYPGNIGTRIFLFFSYPGNIGILDFSYFLIILKTLFNGGPVGAGGRGVWGRRIGGRGPGVAEPTWPGPGRRAGGGWMARGRAGRRAGGSLFIQRCCLEDWNVSQMVH